MGKYENKTNNEYGLAGLILTGKGYISSFMFEGCRIYTKIRQDLEEAKIDNIIAQIYLGLKDNEDQFYRVKYLSTERIEEIMDLLDKKIENNRNKIKKEKERKHKFG